VVIVQYTLVQCDVENVWDYNKYRTIAVWFGVVQELIFFAIVIFKFIPQLWKAVGMGVMIPTAANGACFGLVIILNLVWLGLYTAIIVKQSSYSFYGDDGESLIWPEIRSAAAESFFAFFLSISVSACMILAMMKMKNHGVVSGVSACPDLILSSLLNSRDPNKRLAIQVLGGVLCLHLHRLAPHCRRRNHLLQPRAEEQ
jgi:hypothetical protein